MCPNCFPASQAIAPGYVLALAICAVFFIVAVGALWLSSRTGLLDDLEETKFRMLED